MSSTDTSENDLPGVEAELYYLLPGSQTNRRYVSPGGQLNISEYGPRRVLVHDARSIRGGTTFDSHGFTLHRHTSSIDDYGSGERIDRVYMPEMAELVREATGADRVIPFAWMKRTSSPAGGADQPPANDVHVDYTPEFAEVMARRALAWAGVPADSFRRFVVVNSWRSYSGPPQDWPLGLCDANTVGPDEGVAYPILFVDRLPTESEIRATPPGHPSLLEFPAISAFRFSPEHHWYYFSDTTPDEVILFRNYDSERCGTWRVPHAGFRDPSCPPTRPRLSIESRFLAFYRS